MQLDASSTLRSFEFVDCEGLFIAKTGYTGEEGYEIILSNDKVVAFWQALLANGVRPCGLGARDTLRLEAGLNLYGSDMDSTTTPLESNLAWTVAFDPEDRLFIGRAALELQKTTGITRKLVGLVLKEQGIPRAHQKVCFADGEAGEITSGTFSPTLELGIALARVPAHAKDDCFIEIRQKQIPAKMIKPPFVRHGKKNFI
jgi:aminomethyltransferase